MEPILTLINIAFFCVCSAAALRFVYYLIGEPRGLIGRPGGGEVTTGRILSSYGVMILRGFDKFEAKENKRLEAIYNEWYTEYQVLNGTAPVQAEVRSKNLALSRRRRNNYYSSLGACFMCFSTWLSILLWGGFYYFFNVNILYLIVLIPSTVILAKRF
jgi:hypothetical protein